ncbi:TniQ family protein [Lysinibacillus sp. FSL L8-0126]|uniref:TniQ family protein n=1 Tax=Lysinibacillus sp. FSL L8-0126 TaxID=2921515 RepID=UPI003159F0CB
MLPPFLNKVLPKEHESLHSFIFRTIEENYYERWKDVFPLYVPFENYNGNEINSDSKWLPFAESIVNDSNQDINKMVCNQYDSRFYPMDDKKHIKRNFYFRMIYLRNCTKYCPACLKEDYYHRIYWDVSFLTVCTKHNVQLIMDCLKCKKHIPLHSLLGRQCKCGYHFIDSPHVSVEEKNIIKIQKVFLDALLDYLNKVKRSDNCHLDGKEYLRFFCVFFRLLKYLPIKDFNRSETISNFHHFCSNMTEIKGYEIEYMTFMVQLIHELIIQPEKELLTLFALKDELKNRNGGSNASWKKSLLLKELFQLPKGDYYFEFFTKYNFEYKKDYIHRNGVVKLDPLQKNYVGITDAERLIGTSKHFIRNLCKLNHLKHETVERNGKKVLLIEKESLFEWKKHMDEIISTKEVRHFLGVNHRQYRELMEAKMIKQVHGPSIDGFPWYYVSRKDVLNLDKLLRSKCKTITVVNDDWVTLDTAKDRIAKEEISFIEMLQLVMNNKINVANLKSKPIIEGLYFSIEEIQKMRAQSFGKFAEEKGYAKQELQRIFRIRPQVLNKWLDTGKLQINHTERKGKIVISYVNKKQVIDMLIAINEWTETETKRYLELMEEKFANI